MVADTYNKLFLFASCLLNYYLNLLIQSFYTVSESWSCWFCNRYHRNKSTPWEGSLKNQRQWESNVDLLAKHSYYFYSKANL